ncbi:RagB/SusD domain-containing protein [Bacteroides heparinolyticus]|uniref:RagB/SusD domain-containing protein n=1 Tax=Prevotella heparinolytica TaxID=28113 RepID=A0A449I178_9BACE|nr:RagB/SusD family nutrient uptake outer membrane protein [Bacteroides heparinolyticus]VFB13158.1 RagB/SusD domain-containing protein [Bacteroides heparinolyticus]
MKHFQYTLFSFFSAALFLTGCDLDRIPQDTLTLENYFNNQKELETYTNGFYAIFPTAETIYGEQADIIIPTTLTEEVLGIRTIPASGGGWSWISLSDINTYLKYSGNCPDQAIREQYDGLARFFRAYFYFEKIKRFGEVPWYDKPLTSTDNKLYTPRTSREELLTKVIEDVDYAIAHLQTNKSLYRVTKWTALALKSRIALFEGTFRKYHQLTGSDTYLQIASEAAKEFMDNSPYLLYTTGAQPYLELFATDKAIDMEVILARNYNTGQNIVHSVNQYFISGGSKPGVNKKIIDSYLNADGTRFTDMANYQTLQYHQEMQNRDPRLSQTVITPGYKRIGGSTVLSPSFSSATTGYQVIKWVTGIAQDGYNKSYNDMILFRAAEVLLNYAESKAELGTLTQSDLDASINKIRARVGMPALYMSAANATPDPYLQATETGYPNVTGDNKGVILEIRRERTIELLGEGFRYYDLIRWKEGKTFEKQFKGMYFPALDAVKKFKVYDLNGNGMNDAQDICIYADTSVPTSDTYPELANVSIFLKLGENVELENGENGGNVIIHDIRNTARTWNENRDYLYPIPQDQITLYGGKLIQNPNW